MFITCLSYDKTVTTINMKRSDYVGNGSGIMPSHSPGGSTLQWSERRGFLCFQLLFIFTFYYLLFRLRRYTLGVDVVRSSGLCYNQ